MDAPTYFQFEQAFVDSLRCVPMAVRFKLDQCGIKLSLRQWSRLTVEDRRTLAQAPCAGAAETAAYRARLIGLIAERAGQAAAFIPVEAEPVWAALDAVPEGVAAKVAELGRAPLSLAQWRALSPLQRFALVKLSRDGHENENFAPALAEFGLELRRHVQQSPSRI